MKNWKSILLLALVFFAGVAVGVVGTRSAARRFVQQVIAQPERFQAFVERDLARKLRLDESQQAKLHEILSDTRGQLKDLRQQYRPQAVLIFSNADSEITALLTSEQLARYEKFKESNRPILRALRPAP
jgi:hypothetical protein